MQEITIVTAFFDIGRKNIKGFQRDNQTYLNYFKFWARIKNKMIIYTDSKTVDQIAQIRKNFDLLDQTTIIPVDEVEKLVPTSYEEIKKALSNPLTQKFRKNPQAPESYNAKYTYVTFLKPWLVAHAVNNDLASGMIAWVDFGYNHGGETYLNENEFNFLWSYNFTNKIHLFTLKPINTLPVFEIVRQMPVDMTAGIIVAPDKYWNFLSESFVNSISHLSHCGLSDDDQTLLIMAYRKNPQLFELHQIQDWFLVFKNFGGNHLTINLKGQYKIEKQSGLFALKNKQYLLALNHFIIYSKQKLIYLLNKKMFKLHK